MWNPNQPAANAEEEDDSWEVKAFAEDTGNIMGTTWPPRSYTCTFCRREFRSAQALGGHMNVHRRDRALLHQTQPSFISYSDSTTTSSSSSSFFMPTQKFVSDGGLCVLYSLPNHNSLFHPLRTFVGNPTTGNLMNSPMTMAPRNPSSSLCDSSNPKTSMSNNANEVILTNSAAEEIDLELRLGPPSSP